MTIQFTAGNIADVDVSNPSLGAALALMLSSQAVLVLVFGIADIQGSSLLTGAFLSAVTVAIFALSVHRDFQVTAPDCLFGILVLCVIASFALNEGGAQAKEIGLLILSLAAYPACRFVSPSRLDGALPAFIWITVTIVTVGTMWSAVALFQQWDDLHGKPLLFGLFDGAAVYFLSALAFLIMAMVARGLTARITLALSALAFLPILVFSASLVRFTFIALVLTLCVAAASAASRQRKYIAFIIAVVVVGIFTGQIARHERAIVLFSYLNAPSPIKVRPQNGEPIFLATANRAPRELAPSCLLDVNSSNNSVATRKALLRDAVALIPLAGPAGLGLEGFMKFSCIKWTEAHNSILQATVEFGWIGGLSLALLISISIWRVARSKPQERFVLYGLIYVTLLSMAHGRISRDGILFAFLGFAAAAQAPKKHFLP